ncbi:MAG: hypothetical protein NTW45_10435 [Rhodocyclales bacterium]|nr:hypothetical protein [Rhodocyclales bacterium]
MSQLNPVVLPGATRVSGGAGSVYSNWLRLASSVVLLAGCASPAPPPSTQHLEPAPPVTGKAPEFSVAPALPKPPKPAEKPELYSVVVHETGVQDLLFALARDAKVNVSVHPGISGTVTMSVLDQTLTEILDTISKQVDMRYEMNGKSLSITQDLPYLKMYRIDYPNIARSSQSSVSISTNVASTGGGPGGGGGGGSGSNASDSKITNTADNLFWKTLVANLTDLLRETDKVQLPPRVLPAQRFSQRRPPRPHHNLSRKRRRHQLRKAVPPRVPRPTAKPGPSSPTPKMASSMFGPRSASMKRFASFLMESWAMRGARY